ncbi:MAG: 4Fe-4S dicluster domain-containing protein [Roseovarius sp.]|nr:4Fe-4S dicluster domain-containing protein [Roseovarius sp.]
MSIDLFCRGKDPGKRPAPHVNLVSQKMGIHEWSYANTPTADKREAVPLVKLERALKDRALEVELGFDPETAFIQAERCLNCDAQTVFSHTLCIECDACADICPTSCISFVENGPEDDLRSRLTVPALNTDQDIYVSATLNTGRVLVKDEDVCLHCGLCAERCPTTAWDMQMFFTTRPRRRLTRWRSNETDQWHQRLRGEVRERERLWFGQRQPLVREGDLSDGHPGQSAQHLSVEHPGPADLVRGEGQFQRVSGSSWRC